MGHCDEINAAYSKSFAMKATMQNLKRPANANISPEEYQLIQQLRARNPAQQPIHKPSTLAERLADRVVEGIGSWKFIVVQSILLLMWIVINVAGALAHWDPYPFILLNLMLSFQDAYTAPIIMMSQNRQAQIDREDAKHDYELNLKSELEIELLHDKINLLREEEIVEVLQHLKSQPKPLELLSLLKSQQTQMTRLEHKFDSLLREKL
jgi:uncharacterized membrane protein